MSNFLIGALDPQDASYDGSGVNPNVPDVNNPVDALPDNTGENQSDTKPNWYLYGVIGIIALAILLSNRK